MLGQPARHAQGRALGMGDDDLDRAKPTAWGGSPQSESNCSSQSAKLSGWSP